jgi:hypothetical protein
MFLTMSKLAAQIIGLSEDEQAHIQAVTARLAADPELRSKLEAAEREGAGEGLPAFFPDLAWARLVRHGGAPVRTQRRRGHPDMARAGPAATRRPATWHRASAALALWTSVSTKIARPRSGSYAGHPASRGVGQRGCRTSRGQRRSRGLGRGRVSWPLGHDAGGDDLRLVAVNEMVEIRWRRVVRAQAIGPISCKSRGRPDSRARWVQVDRADDLDPGHADGRNRRHDYADLPAGHLPRDWHRPAPGWQQLLPAVDDPWVPRGHERAGDHAWPTGRSPSSPSSRSSSP